MGLLNIFRRRAAEQTHGTAEDPHRMVSSAPSISAEQERTNRDLMERQMAESRSKREGAPHDD